MGQANTQFVLDPLVINETLAKGAMRRLQDECIENIRNLDLNSTGGSKNLQKKCKALFRSGKYSGLYLGDKNCFAMLVIFDERKNMFGGAYIARVKGRLSLYDSDIRFSKHSVARLIQRLRTKEPRVSVAKAIHVQTRFVISREQQRVINIHREWRAPGLNDVEVALPYVENGTLLGMWFMASTSNITSDFVTNLVAKTFVDSDKLREPQYAKCMEAYHAELKGISMGKKMPGQDVFNRNIGYFEEYKSQL